MSLRIKQNVKLAPYTTFGIGGPARYFCEIKSIDELLQAVKWAVGHIAGKDACPIFVLGGGSNILVSDGGFDGLVILLNLRGFKHERSGLLEIAAGENWDEVTKRAIALNLQGIECLSGIPGSVGGALAQNIDAYGQSLNDVFESAEVLDINELFLPNSFKILPNPFKNFTKEDCQLGYHESIFKQNPQRYIITSVKLKLNPNLKPSLDYQDYRFSIRKYLEETGKKQASLADVRDAIINIRNKKGMLISPNYKSYKTNGSFFKNPVVSQKKFGEIKNIAQTQDAEKEKRLRPWHREFQDGSTKVSAAFLLEYTLWQKGNKHSKAAISPKHILSIINPDNATASDVLELARAMQKSVKEKFGIILEPELNFVGFTKYPLLFSNQ